MKNKIKAIIYDFDGTLVDSEKLHMEAWDQALIKFNLSLASLPAFIRDKMTGKKPLAIAKEITSHFKLTVEPEYLFKLKTDLFMKSIPDRITLMTNLKNIFIKQKKEGYILAIGSSGERNYIVSILNKHKLLNFFDTIVTGEDITYSKPNPETYIRVMNDLCLSPSECLVIEDASTGVISAKAAGCFCFKFGENVNDLDGADEKIDFLEDIVNKINQKTPLTSVSEE